MVNAAVLLSQSRKKNYMDSLRDKKIIQVEIFLDG